MSPLTVGHHDSTLPIDDGTHTLTKGSNHGRVAPPNGYSNTHWESTTPMDARSAVPIGPTSLSAH